MVGWGVSGGGVEGGGRGSFEAVSVRPENSTEQRCVEFLKVYSNAFIYGYYVLINFNTH